jgi:hypothetical protein
MTSIKCSFRIGLLLITIITQPLCAQWAKIDGSHGGSVPCLTAIGTDLYAGTNAGLFRLSSGEKQWVLVNGTIPAPVTCVAAIGDTLFAGTSGAGVYRLTDGGATATPLNAGFATDASTKIVTSILASPDGAGGMNLYAGTGLGLYQLSGQGSYWTIRDSGLAVTRVNSMFTERNGIGGTYLYATNYYGCFFSTDYGTSWSSRGNGFPPLLHGPFGMFASTDSAIFVIKGEVYRSTDHGSNWIATTAIPAVYDRSGNVIVVGANNLAAMGQTIFASNGCCIYRSTNNGQSWIWTGTGLPRYDISISGGSYYLHTVLSIAVQGSLLFAGTIIGVDCSTDEGASWTMLNAGLDAEAVAPLAVGGHDVYAVERGGYFLTRSTDDGTSWLPWTSDSLYYQFEALAANDSVLAIQTATPWIPLWGPVVYRCRANDTQWDSVGIRFPSALGINDRYIFAGGFVGPDDRGVDRCSLDSSHWTYFGDGMSKPTNVATIASNGSNVYAGRFLMGISRSFDDGVHWSQVNDGFDTTTCVTSIAINGSTVYAGTGSSIPYSTGSAFITRGVFRSTDNGDHWNTVNSGLTDTDIVALAVHGSIVFAGTSSGGVFVSTNNSDSWTTFNDGLPRLEIASLGINDTYVYAGILGGLYRRPLADVVTAVGDPPKSVPTRFGLSQNYPNPFNPSTNIGYTIASSKEQVAGSTKQVGMERVRLVVYDLLGREVAVLSRWISNAGRTPGNVRCEDAGVGRVFLSAGCRWCCANAEDGSREVKPRVGYTVASSNEQVAGRS